MVTEIIPTNWELKRLGSITNIYRGASPRPIDDPKWFDETSKIGWMRISDVTKSHKYLFQTVQSLSQAGINCSRFVPKHNLIMSICATVGRPIIIKKDVCIHDGFVIFEKPKADIEYLYYYLSFIEKEWSKHGQTGSQMNLNTTIIGNEPILLPKLKEEQSAIAQALSDTDNLIGSLNKLIRKKKNIKKGVMQELLTGKKRLPGFSGEWEVKKLGEVVGRITTGKLDANAMTENGEYRFYTCAKKYYFINKYAFDTEALLVSGNGANVGYIHYYKGKFNAYQRTYVLTDFSENILFIKLFMDRNLQERIRVEVNAGNTPYITMDTLSEMSIMFPPTIEEQTIIVTILSDMDAEIESLEQKRDKYIMLKQGMMQQLLTGRIRIYANN